MSDFYDLNATDVAGNAVALSAYKGRVLLIVNTASKCGFTPQYEGLEALQGHFHDRGFDVLAFPCNQFGHQEPGSDSDIAEFCSMRFSTSFPLFSKIEVNGPNTHPVYAYLKKQAPGVLGTTAIKWNFTKFLVNAQGQVVKRYGSQTKPEAIAFDIEALLPAS